jgi:hypothetical protein
MDAYGGEPACAHKMCGALQVSSLLHCFVQTPHRHCVPPVHCESIVQIASQFVSPPSVGELLSQPA